MVRAELAPLVAELDRWESSATPATFWWRDDDAATACPALDRLLSVADGRPVALAAVPVWADRSLADRLAAERHVTIVQHGWQHENHADGNVSSEYPPGRPIAVVAREFADGQSRLSAMFGSQYAPVFTPPWHGLHDGYLPYLVGAGFIGLSSKGRRAAATIGGLSRNNVHCVPIQWSDPPGFGDAARYVGQLVDHLKRRRQESDRDEATGILTHHRVQNAESWDFVRSVLDLIDDHPFAALASPGRLFAAGL